MIIGITGYNASGKDTVALYLTKRGFAHYSLSDEIREEAKKKKIKITRDNLIKLGNELRERFGPSILAERVKNKLKQNQDYVITSIRNPAEAQALAEDPQFILIAVTADKKKRFELLKKRAKEEDPKTFEEFVAKEKMEESSDPHKQQLHIIHKMAKITIKNDSTIDDLQAKVDKVLLDVNKKFRQRPSWDDYFFQICHEVAQRATCDRGKAGAVVVRDKRILCTGYVGSPTGMPHCDEVGHQLKTVIHEDGNSSQHCMRTIHAEQNAICQAAREGISLMGATIYCKFEPCVVCARMMSNCGIVRVVCEKRYHKAQETRELFRQAKITLEVLKDEVQAYARQ